MNKLFITLLFIAGLYQSLLGSGLTFLQLDVSARTGAMGGASAAFYHEVAGMHYNPAGIAAMPSSEVELLYSSWIQDMSMQYAGIVLAQERASLGISIYNAMVEGIEIREVPGPPEGTFTARNFSGGITYAYRISPSFKAGITGKFLFEKIFVDEAHGFAADLGLIYQSPTPGLNFGFSVTNIGSMSKLRNESTELPLTYRIGSMYDLPEIMENFQIILALDLLHSRSNDDIDLLFGTEIGYLNTIYLRAGYYSGIDSRGLSTGIGIRHGIFKFNYSYIPLRFELGSGHTISVGFTL